MFLISVVGIPGIGKSRSSYRALSLFSSQVVLHDSFPGVVGPYKQLLYLQVEVPASGKLFDLAKELMRRTDEALGASEFEHDLRLKNGNPTDLFNRWLHVARRHSLGLVVFDEVQNLFKIETKRTRQRRDSEEPRELRIIEDQALKCVLNIANVWRIPAAFLMTPDGMEAFSTRAAVTQRLGAGGHHRFQRALSSEDTHTVNSLLPVLQRYQYVHHPLELGDEECAALYEMTGFVPRVLIKAWRFGQRVAIQENSDRLSIEHIRTAMDTYLAPVRPSIAALLSNTPGAMQRYQDLLPPQEFWARVA